MEVLWLRRDVRISDNAALFAAVEQAQSRDAPLCIVFVYDTRWIKGAHCHASHCEFVAQGLREMESELKARSPEAEILVCAGRTEDVLDDLHAQHAIRSLWTHTVVGDSDLGSISAAVGEWCEAAGVEQHAFDQYGLVSTGRLQSGKSVFASSFEAAMSEPALPPPSLARARFTSAPPSAAGGRSMRASETPDWQSMGVDGGLRRCVPVGGESHAQACLDDFLTRRGKTYASGLSSPVTAWDSCSRLSAYLAWGHISLRTVVQRTKRRQDELRKRKAGAAEGADEPAADAADAEGAPDLAGEGGPSKPARGDSWLRSLQHFQSRLRWRSHFMQKLHDQPDLCVSNVCRGYDGMREEDFATLSADSKCKLDAWLSGRTGFPFVDACMRALHDCGWINFRMRCMLVSFASYHLWLSWKHLGPPLAKLFIDYEPGIHYPQLQMQSGTTGINSNRIYDPDKQRADHDPLCEFTRRYVPELAGVPLEKLATARGLDLLADYPPPIVLSSEAVRCAREKLKEFNYLVKHQTSEGQGVFQKHGSRRPNAGDLQRSTAPRAKRPRTDAAAGAQGSEAEPLGQPSTSEAKLGVVVELARSSRSGCRCCGGAIEKGAARCGLEVRVRARWSTLWCHARCFLSSCTRGARYRGSRASSCSGSGRPIARGATIVRFSVGDASAKHLPESASKIVGAIASLVGADAAREWLASSADAARASSDGLPDEQLRELLRQLLSRQEAKSPAAPLVGSGKFKQLDKSTSGHAVIDLSD